MEAIDELIDAAQTFYDESARDSEWALPFLGALLSRVSRCADRPLPGLRLFEPAPRLLPGELGDVQGLVLPPSEGLQGADAHRREDPEARI